MEDGDVSGSTIENKGREIIPRNENGSSSNKNGVEISLATASTVFPGFRFSPTDEELISYYLLKKLEGSDKCVEVISEVEIWKHEPWDLPAKSVIQSDNEWFFFSPRGRKYPNGSQSKRATESGYWKATGKERNIKSGSNLIGTKRTLVFHSGRAPKGQRTHWIMHEYCTSGNSNYQDSMVICRLRKNNEFHLNDTPGSRRNKSAATDCTSASCGAGQSDGLEPANAGNCWPKDCSSSFNSQLDSGSDSDKLTKEVSQHDSSNDQKDFEDGEAWFSDIMKDDIVELDESSFKSSHDLLSIVTRRPEPATRSSNQHAQDVTSHVLPFQGTANRRLKLQREKVEPYQEEGSESYGASKKNDRAVGTQRITRWLINLFPMKKKQLLLHLFLVTLILLVMFLTLLGVSQQVKWLRRLLVLTAI